MDRGPGRDPTPLDLPPEKPRGPFHPPPRPPEPELPRPLFLPRTVGYEFPGSTDPGVETPGPPSFTLDHLVFHFDGATPEPFLPFAGIVWTWTVFLF